MQHYVTDGQACRSHQQNLVGVQADDVARFIVQGRHDGSNGAPQARQVAPLPRLQVPDDLEAAGFNSNARMWRSDDRMCRALNDAKASSCWSMVRLQNVQGTQPCQGQLMLEYGCLMTCTQSRSEADCKSQDALVTCTQSRCKAACCSMGAT